MRALVQRVNEAWVRVGEQEVARIADGALILLGIARDDTMQDVEWTAQKVAQLRIFDDEKGRLNHSCVQVEGAFLVVSQFTLYGNCLKGNRPSYIQAAAPDEAKVLYRAFITCLQKEGFDVQEGCFREHMKVGLINDGPVTVLVESRK